VNSENKSVSRENARGRRHPRAGGVWGSTLSQVERLMSILSRPCPPFKVRERNDLECITCVIYIMRIQPAEVGRRESALRNIMPRVFRPVAASIVQVTAVLTGRDPETMALARTPRPPSEEFLFREHYTATPDPLACDRLTFANGSR
jgi:hypothetical protein